MIFIYTFILSYILYELHKKIDHYINNITKKHLDWYFIHYKLFEILSFISIILSEILVYVSIVLLAIYIKGELL